MARRASDTGPVLYRVLAALIRPFVRALFRPRVLGLEHVPARGFVLAANHLSGFDTLALSYAVYPRGLSSMAKLELFRTPLLGRLIASAGAFPATPGFARGGAVPTAAAHARAGSIVVIFPTGARRRADRAHRPRTGAARVALEAHVPLVPAAIRGTDGWRRLRRWQVVFGQPVPLDDLGVAGQSTAREATRRLWRAVQELEARLEA